jgi:hypothetical protein
MTYSLPAIGTPKGDGAALGLPGSEGVVFTGKKTPGLYSFQFEALSVRVPGAKSLFPSLTTAEGPFSSAFHKAEPSHWEKVIKRP